MHGRQRLPSWLPLLELTPPPPPLPGVDAAASASAAAVIVAADVLVAHGDAR